MAPQDSFIEEEEDTCPLCIEEFDLSDRNFRPCPCGYQVCQFCFNNIKNNMNGLCPACRRPYDEKTIEWKVVTTEEVAEFRANIQKNQKKRALDQRQKELQKREAEKENRKNLIGVRVVQKNLVYITGLAPTVREDELLKTLRKPEFFGQYGNIQKISISNRKSSDGQHQSLGIYVTFETPEEATRCIQAVHGSQNGDRVLKAQHGTTKYCSAWLKNEKCSNPGCMFLHEQGDEEDSYSRQDLSSMNSIHTQRPFAGGSSRSVSRQQAPQPTPPPAVSYPMARTSSKEGSENGVDGSALPSSANWARNPQRSRRGSHATSGAASSPAISTSLPVTAEVVQEEAGEEDNEEAVSSQPSPSAKSEELEPVPPEPSTSSAIPESSLIALLKALQTCTLPALPDEADDSSPPMFDIRGGEKRKAMREEEDSRITGEQEEQAETQEPVEEEPETGGSLALGGEPEDREAPADNHSFEQRRPGTQPPIQRSNTDGIFGPALTGSNFSQGSGNPISRTMTPQQLYMRSQSGFGDQVPPGITNQSNVFQNQGHNRQSSRFSFANDNANSATNVKLAANPRIMAQQSSMMPNSFQSQGGNQFYGTSMPGPPPGLKSTGTPPSMFGQAFGRSGFGGASKDNSSDVLLQSLLDRNRGANNQAHDAGKRELLISSFSNQYPPSSTSTPAPASGFLSSSSSLYGGQPGALQDFGSKQKKKGKKHRHANTSSSGGSGLVDLADPSILQARMQHQSQGNAGVGQGLFGGQSQGGGHLRDQARSGRPGFASGVSFVLLGVESISGGLDILAFSQVYFFGRWGSRVQSGKPSSSSTSPLYDSDELPSLDEASNSVDALVSDDPPIIAAELGGRTSVPPGLALPHGHPAAIPRPASTQSQSRFGHIVPALPKVPPPGLSQIALTPEHSPKKPTTPDTAAKKNIKALAAESGLSKEISSQAQAGVPQGGALHEEDFPTLNSSMSNRDRPATPTPKPTPKAKRKAERIADKLMEKLGPGSYIKPAPTAAHKAAEAEKKLIAINTQVARAVASMAGETSTSTEKSTTESSVAFPPLPTPSAATVSSPISRPAPKTLRVLPTPKTEAPPPTSPALTMASISLSGASRAMSVSHRPDTPASEMISDTASVMSASVSNSRASSPPPSRVGAAAVRAQTKSQQRKARKDQLKQETKLIAEVPIVKAETVEQAPIIGRKKKQKKEKPAKASGSQSGATTPSQEPSKEEAIAAEALEKEMQKEKVAEEKPAKSKAAQKKAAKAKGREKEREKEAATPPPPPPTKEPVATESAEPAEKPQPGPTSVFAEIKRSLWTPTIDKLHLLKPITGGSSRLDHSQAHNNANKAGHCKDCSCKCGEIQDEDLVALRAGKPVRKQFHVDGSRMLITPNGDCIRGLTTDEEDAFLELQAAIAATAENPGAFVAPRHQPGSGAFSLIKGRAVPNGRPNIFPATAQPQSQDPIGKLQREDALSYINQYVLPRLNLGATNMGFPKGTSPTKDAAAASLNSLAPYFYGPDAAAGVGIYSPPDGARAMQDFGSASMQSEEGGKNAGMGVGGMPLMSVEDAEGALSAARRETEKLEKGLNQVIKRNRRLLLGGGN
ncbi:Fc.00g113480.m01.CDS01 [Cosmosporella sp. VM-42]